MTEFIYCEYIIFFRAITPPLIIIADENKCIFLPKNIIPKKGVKEEKGTYFVHFANSNMAVVLVHP